MPRVPAAQVDRTQRIYVNRNLRLGSVQAIGFDMDHTLALYKPLPFESLAFEKARAKLAARGYPGAVLDLQYDHEFVTRGLIVDKRRGNILKMDRHHYVVQTYHGTRKLPPEMRKRLYARRRIRVSAVNYSPVDTLFSLPEISLYAQLVDLLDKTTPRPNYHQLYEDVRSAVDEAHADGSIKRVIARSPLRFVEIDPHLPATLNRMRAHGMKLFLLTNSEPFYTNLIMGCLLNDRIPTLAHWTDYFDLVVMRSRKPGFFVRHEPLVPLDARVLGLKRGRRPRFSHTGGGVGDLEQALGVGGDAVLYFGDHTYGDILKSKRSRGWRTAMIIPELAAELRQMEAASAQWRAMEALEVRLDHLAATSDFIERALAGEVRDPVGRKLLRDRGLAGGQRQMRMHLESCARQMLELTAELRRREAAAETPFNPYWGPIFRAGREISHFGNQVAEFACIYMAQVSSFLSYPMDKYFLTPRAFMPHET